MALETLKNLDRVEGEFVVHFPDGDGHLEDNCINYIQINHEKNTIKFKIQDGPIRESGKNGVQLTALIIVARQMVNELNKKFPNEFNMQTIIHLDRALEAQQLRTEEREARGVEGTSKC